MEAKVNREALLRALELTRPGLSDRELVEQSTCLVFRGGRVYTYNDETSVSGPTGLPEALECAVSAEEVIESLRKMSHDEVRVRYDPERAQLTFQAAKTTVGFSADPDVRLPIQAVDAPGEWHPLPEDFGEAIDFVQGCAGQDSSRWVLTCVNIAPEWIEACQPPGTMVMTSDGKIPIEDIRPGHHVWSYSYQKGKTYRCIVGANKDSRNKFKHGHLVTRVSERPYTGDLVVLKTSDKTTKYTTDHECLVRLDDVFYKKYIVYVQRRDRQFRVGVTSPRRWKGQWARPRREGRSDVRGRMNLQRADACWVLACFDTEAEALMEERLVTVRYGIPDMLFRVRPSESKKWREVQTQCDLFWERFGDNFEKAETCLTAYGRRIDYPFAERTLGPSGRILRKSHMCDAEIKIRACNMMEGMKVLDVSRCDNSVVRGDCWVQFTLSREPYSGPVYSMTVDRSHTYVADGIITHNCDDTQLCRWKMQTGVTRAVLIKQSSASGLRALGVSGISEGKNWVHFHNPQGVVLSCRRYVDDFPSEELTPVLSNPGRQVTLPKAIKDACEAADVFTRQHSEDNVVTVTIRAGAVVIEGRGITGWYRRKEAANWDGPEITFQVPPKLLAEVVGRYNAVELTDRVLRVDTGSYCYVTCLRAVVEEEEKPRRKKEKTTA